MTVRRILELLQQQGPCTRADLTRLSGISAPTVSKAVASLLDAGLLEEGEMTHGAPGRPGTVFRLARENALVIGVVLDAARCRVVSAALDGQLHEDELQEFITPGSYDRLIHSLADACRKVVERRQATPLCVGMSIPGLVNRRERLAVFSPNLHLTDGRSPCRDLSERLDVECTMFQETHALCLAERMYNGATNVDDFVMLDVSTGLGLGVMLGGRLLEGHSGIAGELGHITVDPNGRLCGCGNHGCLETVATDSALARAISDREGRGLNIDAIIQLVQDGQLNVERELSSVCEYLSIAVAAAINVFNPALLFVYGRLFDIRDGLFELVCQLTRERTLAPSFADCRIVRARCTKLQAAVAAAVHHLTDAQGPVVD